jgi:excisionase family DNA binding protein
VLCPWVLSIPDVAEILNTSAAQVRALLFSGDLRGIKIGGRGQWRVEVSELEAYIQRQYAQTDRLTRQGATHAGVDPRVDPGEDPTPKN